MTAHEKHEAICVVCAKKFMSSGTLADAIREAKGIDRPKDASSGVGLCSFRCGLEWFRRRLRGEVE